MERKYFDRQWWVSQLVGVNEQIDSSHEAFTNISVDIARFQMVSLLKLARVTEEGVRFLSPHDGTPMYV